MKKYPYVRYIVALLALFSPMLHAENIVEKNLKQSLVGKMMLLRTPYMSKNLKFDEQMQLLGISEIGAWPIEGLLLVQRVSLKSAELEITGKRHLLIMKLSEPDGLSAIPTHRYLKITLKLSAPITQQDQALRLIDLVFVGGNMPQRFGSYWKPLTDVRQPCDEIKKNIHDGIVGHIEGSRPVAVEKLRAWSDLVRGGECY